MSNELNNRRLLIVDDNPAIHEDIRKVLCPSNGIDLEFEREDEFLFGSGSSSQSLSPSTADYLIDSVYQGRDALDAVSKAVGEQQRYAVAVVDMRMPPGWDGIQTVQKLWQADPDLLVIFCTAFSDYSWQEMREQLGRTDQFVLLKKPFDTAEMQQLVAALHERWHANRRAEINFAELARLTKENERLRAELKEATRHTLEPFGHQVDTAGVVHVVDPDELQRTRLCQQLQSAGLEFQAFAHPHDALNELLVQLHRGETVRAIVTELKCDDFQPSAFPGQLRSRGYQGPIVAWTIHDRLADRDVCLNAGYTHWIPKSAAVECVVEAMHPMDSRNLPTALAACIGE